MFLNTCTGTPKTINFPFGTNGKLMVLGVAKFKHFRGFFFFSSPMLLAPFSYGSLQAVCLSVTNN